MAADNHPTSNVSPLTSHVTEDEINLLDYWRVLVKRKLLIGLIVGAALVVSIIYSLTLPPIYASTASIFPPQQEGGMSGIASTLWWSDKGFKGQRGDCFGVIAYHRGKYYTV